MTEITHPPTLAAIDAAVLTASLRRDEASHGSIDIAIRKARRPASSA